MREAARGYSWARGWRDVTGLLFCVLLALACGMTISVEGASALSQRGYVFDKAVATQGSGSGSGQLKSPKGVAVNETTGRIYVVDAGNNRVDVFNAGDEFLEAWGWGVKNGEKELQSCTTSCLAGLAGHGKGELHGAEAIAVDNNPASPSFGDVYVEAVTPYEEEINGKESESETAIIAKFNEAGALLSQIKGFKEPKGFFEEFEEPHGLTVAPNGDLWVYNEEDAIGFTNDLKNKFLKVVATELEGEARPGIAVNAAGDFYLGHSEVEEEKEPTLIAEDTVIEENKEAFGEPIFTALDPKNTTGVTVDRASQDVLLDHGTSIAMYDPNGLLVQSFGAGEAGLTGGSGLAVDPKAGTEGQLIAADSASGQLVLFVPEPAGAPKVDEATVQNTTPSSTEMLAVIDPAGASTEYAFRYSTGAVPLAGQPCEGSCVEVPIPNGTLGKDGEFADISTAAQKIEGLAPATVYHFRVVASNSHGSSESAELKFKTQPAVLSSLLPDGRSWEMVSPLDKNAAFLEAITREGGIIQAAADGASITYVGSNAIDGAEGNRSPEPDQIYSARGGEGWSSKNLATPNTKGEGIIPGSAPEYRFFSSDLSQSFVEPFGEESVEHPPLSPEAEERTIYQRHDLTCVSSPATCFTPLVTAANVTGEASDGKGGKERSKFGGNIEFITANPSGDHALLFSEVPLTSEPTAPGQNLYEWAAGTLTLVNVLPSGRPVFGASIGNGNRIVRRAISEDGSRVIFSVPGTPGHLYLREMTDGKTLRVDKLAPGLTEEIANSHPVFQTADSNDSKIFFTDEEKLTAAATARSGKPDLYVCEVLEEAGTEPSCEVTDLSVDFNAGEAANVQGVVPGAAADGSDVFFIANGALAGSAQPGACVNGEEEREKEAEHVLGATCNLYVVHAEGGGWSPPKLVAALSIEDEPDWGVGQQNDIGNVTSRVSENGEWLSFMSDRSLTGYNNRDAHSGRADEEVFLYSATKGSLVCASCDPTGARPDGVHDVEESGEGIGLLVDRPLIWTSRWLGANVPGWTRLDLEHSLYQSRYLSNEGRLFFNSSQKLVPQDKNNTQDVYEYEPAGKLGPGGLPLCTSSSEIYGEASEGCVALVSGGTPEEKESAFLDASEEGNDVFFDTAAQLAGQDKDSSYDVYDASVCGQPGTHVCLAPPAASPPSCESLGICREGHPEEKPTIASTSPGSLIASGSGNTASREVLGVKVERPKPLTRAQRYAKALKACRKIKNRHKRTVCQLQARKRYGPVKKKAKKSNHHTAGARGR